MCKKITGKKIPLVDPTPVNEIKWNYFEIVDARMKSHVFASWADRIYLALADNVCEDRVSIKSTYSPVAWLLVGCIARIKIAHRDWKT